jgi:hypothetical protein
MLYKKKNWMVVLTVCSFLLIGCGTKFTVNNYPEFYEPSIKSVAVIPFQNETSYRGAGMAVPGHIAAALAANGTYNVTDPARLAQILEEKQMPRLDANDFQAVAAELGQLNKYQAFVGGSVLSDSFIRTVVEYYGDGDFYYDDYPYWYYPYWYSPYWPYYYGYGGEAYISTRVAMVSVPEGATLDAAEVKASANVGGISPAFRKYAAQMALRDLSEKVVSELAIVPVKIKVSSNQALRTASSYQNEQWTFTNTFGSDQQVMYALLCLPETAAKNKFRLTVTPKGEQSDVIASKDITWQRGEHCQSAEFSPAVIARSNGAGKYSVNFLVRDEIILSRNFTIR